MQQTRFGIRCTLKSIQGAMHNYKTELFATQEKAIRLEGTGSRFPPKSCTRMQRMHSRSNSCGELREGAEQDRYTPDGVHLIKLPVAWNAIAIACYAHTS